VGQVIIGMDPHKRSATIEVIDDRETVLAGGRFGTDRDGYKTMLAVGRRFPERVWAVEGCNGIGRHIAQRLVADGESVVDVPAKLSARARVFATGQGRKTDPVDAHSVAVAALRAKGLRPVTADDTTVVLRLLVDRRDGLGHARTDLLNRIHKLMLELLPGGAKKFLSADQARAMLNTIRPRDLVGRTRRRLASELISELVQADKKSRQRTRNCPSWSRPPAAACRSSTVSIQRHQAILDDQERHAAERAAAVDKAERNRAFSGAGCATTSTGKPGWREPEMPPKGSACLTSTTKRSPDSSSTVLSRSGLRWRPLRRDWPMLRRPPPCCMSRAGSRTSEATCLSMGSLHRWFGTMRLRYSTDHGCAQRWPASLVVSAVKRKLLAEESRRRYACCRGEQGLSRGSGRRARRPMRRHADGE
jgi:hypothetical protein